MSCTVAQYVDHARALAKAFKIRMIEDSGMHLDDAFIQQMTRRTPERVAAVEAALGGFVAVVVISPIVSATSYSTALHEIGHEVDPVGNLQLEVQRSQTAVERERWRLTSEEAAWAWAQHHALEWTQEMEDDKEFALNSYRRTLEQALAGHDVDVPIGPNVISMTGEMLNQWILMTPPGQPLQLSQMPKSDPEAARRNAPGHARTAASIVNSIKKGGRP